MVEKLVSFVLKRGTKFLLGKTMPHNQVSGGSGDVNTSFEIGGGTTTAGRGVSGPPVKLTNKALLAKIQADRRRKAQPFCLPTFNPDQL